MTFRSNIFDAVSTLELSNGPRYLLDLPLAEKNGLAGLGQLPVISRIILENLLRHGAVTMNQARAYVALDADGAGELAYRPERIVMQDYSGMSALLDFASLREAYAAKGRDPRDINPRCQVDLVIDHSLVVDSTGPGALARNLALDYQRNGERYEFLRWSQQAFKNLSVVPPGKGIIHQVNIEALTSVVREDAAGEWLFPDTLLGTDSHTTMVNCLGVVGWGVGGIEAEATMLGHPTIMNLPQVIGVRLKGALRSGVLGADAVLTITEILRRHGVTGRFVEFFGPGVAGLSLPDRATIANMAPEYGATCGFFPVDAETVRYLVDIGLSAWGQRAELYCKRQAIWGSASDDTRYGERVEIDLATIEPSVAGPHKPHERRSLAAVPASFAAMLSASKPAKPAASTGTLREGDIVLAALTSCTNTSNPSAMIAAGLLARRAAQLGLRVPAYQKASLAPGSHAVSSYLRQLGLLDDLEAIGFSLVGYGCMTCVGNSGSLESGVAEEVQARALTVASMTSGNRNFEGRIHPAVKANYLGSPPLVVAYALAGRIGLDLTRDTIAVTPSGQAVTLAMLWPSDAEIAAAVGAIEAAAFEEMRENLYTGGPLWQALPAEKSDLYPWSADSTYIVPPSFASKADGPRDLTIRNAHALLVLGDGITTDHISPVGRIARDSLAAGYLGQQGVAEADLNTYGARRGNEQVMVRGAYGNPMLKNELVPDRLGPWTRHAESGEPLPIYEAAQRYEASRTPLIVVAGRDYGAGSARDWAAKSTRFLGVRAVLAESFERIHRSNLALMGVLPLQFMPGENRHSIGVNANTRFDILLQPDKLQPGMIVPLVVHNADGTTNRISVICRLETSVEIGCFLGGGILNNFLSAA